MTEIKFIELQIRELENEKEQIDVRLLELYDRHAYLLSDEHEEQGGADGNGPLV